MLWFSVRPIAQGANTSDSMSRAISCATVLLVSSDIFDHDIPAAEIINKCAKCLEWFLGLVLVVFSVDHIFAAAKQEFSHGGLLDHLAQSLPTARLRVVSCMVMLA